MKKILTGVIGCGILLVGMGAWWLSTQLQPVSGDTTTVTFIVKKGESAASIADRLAEQGLVKNAQVFRYYARLNDLIPLFQSGSFQLSPAMDAHQLAQQLTQGTEDIWITILEGWRPEEVATYLLSLGLPEETQTTLLTAAETQPQLLYPDTYLIPRQIEPATLKSLLENTYQTKIVDQYESEITASSHSLEELVAMASLVQREARDPEDMRKVAGILWKRIEIDMPLQVDATLQYARGQDAQGAWWSPPLAIDKELDSPFNTYVNVGLPPHAISNFGQAAFSAALNPILGDDLFYIHAPDGTMYYAQTYDEHLQLVNRYLR
ncbi:MAG: endolytic transglycosylase MltG [Pseudomonadales bacterium]|nr:endolytic transglycosylase MltG [Candidatus Woesebacteria bacterium]MCB9801696.1 endolytic transglycosylase MltG [Pseudomonadales bacterium]